MKRARSAVMYYIGLGLLYLVLAMFLPANKTTKQLYHLSASQYHIMLLVVILPLLLIWLAAFYGYAKLAEYAALIKKAAEGEDYHAMAIGARWIAWGLPIPAIIGLVLNAIADKHPGFLPSASIIINYLNLAVSLVAFSFINLGAHKLAARSKAYISAQGVRILTLFFVAVGVIFCFLVFQQLNLKHAGDSNNLYYMPTWLAVATIVIPYVYAWFMGLTASYEILLVARKTGGVLYSHALHFLAGGLVVVIASAIVLQYYRLLIPRSGHLSVGFTLLVVYIAELIVGFGYCLLAFGASRLKKIEEV